MKHSIICGTLGAAGIILCATQSQATTFSGNGNSSFGGALGQGSLTLTDDGTTISGTLTRGPGNLNDNVVIYIDSAAGGFTTTSGFNDQNDDLRRSISGVGSSGRSTVNFSSGFTADYAIAFGVNGPNFGGLWTLANGGNNSLPFDTSVNLTPSSGTTSSTYTFNFTLASIGLTPNQGNSFQFVASLESQSGYRSNEAIGASDAPGGDIATGTLTFTSPDTYTSVPEPSSIAVMGLGALGAFGFLRRRK